MNERKLDVIIVGAGISGLTSALKVQQKDSTLKVRVLEMSNRVGGQLGGTRLGEVGGKWLTEDQHHVHRLLKLLNVPLCRRIQLEPHFKNCNDFDEGFLGKLAQYELKRYIIELDIRVDYFKPGIKRKRSVSMKKHIYRRLFFSKSRQYMTNLVLLVSGVSAADISYNDFMSICYTYGGFKRFIDLFIEMPNTLLEFSSDVFLKNILNKLLQTEFMYGRQVCEINQYRDHVEIRDSENEYHTADAVILAIPWNNIQDIYFWPPMPYELQRPPLPIDAAKSIITSFLAKYRDACWHNNHFSGNYISTDPFMVAYEYRPTTIAGHVVHEEGLEVLVRSMVLHQLAEHFGEDMLLPIDFVQRSYELHNRAHLPMTTPWNRVIWSSSSGAGTCYRGCLGGAVQSGIRAAMNALLLTRPQIVTWHDIAEIQCRDGLHDSKVGLLPLWLSTWNLYNISTYTIFLCGLVLVLSRVYTKRSI